MLIYGTAVNFGSPRSRIRVVLPSGKEVEAIATTEINTSQVTVGYDAGSGEWIARGSSTPQLSLEKTTVSRNKRREEKKSIYYPKILSYIEEGDNYNFYLWGDRSPQLIHSIPNTNSIVWGAVSTNSSKKNDWEVGILYYDPELEIIIDSQFWIGDLDYLENNNPQGLYDIGGYILSIINTTSLTNYTVNEVGTILEYLNPSGRGVYGQISINAIFQRNSFNTSPYIYSLRENDSLTIIESSDDTEGASSPIIRDFYSGDFTSLPIPTEVLGESVNLVNNSTIPNLSEIGNSQFDFFAGISSNFANWISETFMSDPASLNIYTKYESAFVQVDDASYFGSSTSWSDFHIGNTDSRLENYILDAVSPSDAITYNALNHPDRFNIFWAYQQQTTNISNSILAIYNASHLNRSLMMPNNISSQFFEYEGTLIKQESILTTDEYPFIPSGHYFTVRQEVGNVLLKLPIIKKDEIIENIITIKFSEIYAKAEARKPEYYFANEGVLTCNRLTEIQRLSTENQEIDLLIGDPQSVNYQSFTYQENSYSPSQGSRIEYNIPSLKYYDSINSAIISFFNHQFVDGSITSSSVDKYWNGAELLDIAIPDENNYYIELKEGKFQGVRREDLSERKKQIEIYEWGMSPTLLTPKKTKANIKNYPSGHTILSASFGK